MAESESRRAEGEIPPNQFLAPEYVLADMARHGSHRINTMSAAQILILGVIGEAFITAGALFSILLGATAHYLGGRAAKPAAAALRGRCRVAATPAQRPRLTSLP